MSPDLSVILRDLQLAGSHVYAHNHLSVDRLGGGQLGCDGDLGVDELAGFVRCKFDCDIDLPLGGGLGVRVLDIVGHLNERLVELLSEGTTGQRFEVDLCLGFLFLHVWDPSF